MIKLKDFPTRAPEELEKEQTKAEIEYLAKRIGELHRIMQAEKKQSLLVVFQGMDASGKDGATRNVFKQCSPHGISAHSFKKPTEEEFAHDFLWRCTGLAPRKGHIQVFIRSHYEDVLIQRVHKWIDEKRVDQRIAAINAWEKLLIQDNNTTFLKFYLHISKDRQEEKLRERIDEPDKQWKHNPLDWEERQKWDNYMFCYEDAINRSEVPWIITPVDQRWYRNFFVAKKVLETMESWNFQYPGLTES